MNRPIRLSVVPYSSDRYRRRAARRRSSTCARLEQAERQLPRELGWANLHGKVVVVSFSPDDVFPNDIDDWKQAARPFEGEHIQIIRIVGGSEFLLDQALK